ncbi:tRNA (Guanine-N(7)-)-methyltransferase [Fasciola gigantica]|uniref:tRNA (guanine-N(7)-)-methyltransferase n=1 Tax=Fasciola gigantica TaxID=46835 RepID=A0A504Z7N3_FASGI|nr:tRNA (Guanine-N(7)-)-methyltransferase [Fasciola gigantica]
MSKRPADNTSDPLTTNLTDSIGSVEMPAKRYYRQRAHCNPWSDHTLEYPLRPTDMNWSKLYSEQDSSTIETSSKTTVNGDNNDSDPNAVRFVDVGCGYGAFLFKLALKFPEKRSLGLEIRLKVSDFVQEKIRALRFHHPGSYGNIACLRTNAMKFLPNFFHKGQLQKLFFLYPDPHFKRMKHKWRIISPTLLDIYAYVLAPGGRVYAATDVLELAQWMAQCLRAHPLFEPRYYLHFNPSEDGQSLLLASPSVEVTGLDDSSSPLVIDSSEKLANACQEDPTVELFQDRATDEANKATREGRGTTILIFERSNCPRPANG